MDLPSKFAATAIVLVMVSLAVAFWGDTDKPMRPARYVCALGTSAGSVLCLLAAIWVTQ